MILSARKQSKRHGVRDSNGAGVTLTSAKKVTTLGELYDSERQEAIAKTGGFGILRFPGIPVRRGN
mgnify:CR=1 FL=1